MSWDVWKKKRIHGQFPISYYEVSLCFIDYLVWMTRSSDDVMLSQACISLVDALLNFHHLFAGSSYPVGFLMLHTIQAKFDQPIIFFYLNFHNWKIQSETRHFIVDRTSPDIYMIIVGHIFVVFVVLILND